MNLAMFRSSRFTLSALAVIASTGFLLGSSALPVAADGGRPPIVRPQSEPKGGVIVASPVTGVPAGGIIVAGQPAPSGGNSGSGGGLVLKPDLLVTYLGPAEFGKDRIEIRNQGGWQAGSFRVAVLAGANSTSLTINGLGAGQSVVKVVGPFGCKNPVAVLVDVDHQIDELLENNNGASFKGSCPIDGGPHKVPESE